MKAILLPFLNLATLLQEKIPCCCHRRYWLLFSLFLPFLFRLNPSFLFSFAVFLSIVVVTFVAFQRISIFSFLPFRVALPSRCVLSFSVSVLSPLIQPK